jgi:thioredoxin 1
MVAFVTELNSENFSSFKENELVLVDVWAPWCGPCKLIGPVVDQISIDFNGQLSVGKLEADSNREIVSELGIRSIPTILLFKNGEEVDRKVGALNKQQLTDLINEHLN